VRTVICDLDGVLYRGRDPIAGSAEALKRLEKSGYRVIFVTNNSSRTPAQVAEKILIVMGVKIAPESILTSALAAVSVLPDNASDCMVVGGEGIVAAVTDSGRRIVQSGADAVIVGIDSNFDYAALTKVADEIRGGALFVASNTDSTFPIESGLLPGAGAIVAALAAASGVDPINAGKPELPMRELVRASGVAEAWVIGDRLETDIALATHEPDWESILVLTGVSDETSDFSSADHVVADLESAVDLVLSTGNRQ
jgi:HAD superfamily hydrolase (TIGR01450 family)